MSVYERNFVQAIPRTFFSFSQNTQRQPFLYYWNSFSMCYWKMNTMNTWIIIQCCCCCCFFSPLFCIVNNEYCLRLSNRFFVLNFQPQIVLLPCKLQASNIPFFLLQMHRCLLCMARLFFSFGVCLCVSLSLSMAHNNIGLFVIFITFFRKALWNPWTNKNMHEIFILSTIHYT